MPDFAYTARDTTGRKIAGTLSAASRQEALAQLDRQALFPLDVSSEAPRASGGSRRVKPQIVATLYGQLADLLRSGVPLLRALDVLRRQSSSVQLQQVLETVHDQVEEGQPLSDALARHPRVFNEMAVSMVRAGSEGGFLEEALQRVASFTEMQEDLKGRVQGALAYPTLLACIGMPAIAVLVIFFVPMFDPMFDRLRQRGELPMATDWLLWLSVTLQSWWWLIALVVAGTVMLVISKLRTEEGLLLRDRLKLRVPGFATIFLNLAVARFCRVLGTLLQNGVPILRALDISSDATGNRVLSVAVREAAENISAGQSLAKPLASSGQFPADVIEMISVAEESGNLDGVLIQIADGLERRTWRQLDLMVRLLEPIMLLLLAIVVLMLAIALLLPMIKMGSAI